VIILFRDNAVAPITHLQ